MRQIIIARKDLNMSPGKLAAQVAHASIAFLSRKIRGHATPKYRPMYVGSNDVIYDTEHIES